MLGALEKEVSPQKLTVSKRIPPTRPLSKRKNNLSLYTQISFTVFNRKAQEVNSEIHLILFLINALIQSVHAHRMRRFCRRYCKFAVGETFLIGEKFCNYLFSKKVVGRGGGIVEPNRISLDDSLLKYNTWSSRKYHFLQKIT